MKNVEILPFIDHYETVRRRMIETIMYPNMIDNVD